MKRIAREMALQVLFQREYAPVLDIHKSLQLLSELSKASPGTQKHAKLLCTGLFANQSAVDEKIRAACPNWSLDRMALVDLSILRLACFELTKFAHSTPPKVVMNEAIEIAKKYGSEDSPRFINGVLNEIFQSK